MDDENVASFINVTGATPEKARQYLQTADNNVEGAVELFYNMGGIDLAGSTSTPSQATQAGPPVPESSRPRQPGEVINLDSDDERDTHPGTFSTEDEDAAMARRLQDEMYGAAGGSSGVDAEGYRAPIAPTRETLVGPGSYDMEDPDEMRAAVLEQMQQRQRRAPGRPGIFNQQAGSSSIWNETAGGSERQAELSRATGGASERSSKSGMLAEMFRPPFEIMSRLAWDDARQEGKDEQKWILVNVQDSSIFDCQLLNRDLWKHEGIKETIKENFIFMQYSKDDPRGQQYMQYYFQERDLDSSYPHIAIVDPRTGEQVKVWSGPPAPKAMDFLMQLHEFLDRYSLSAAAKNPVAKRKPEAKKESQVERMTEEQQLELALQQSLAGSSAVQEAADPDDLTRSVGDLRPSATTDDVDMGDDDNHVSSNGQDVPAPSSSAFASIASDQPHTEPSPDPSSTRIQLRHPTGRVVRRFALADPVRRIYEWLKASPLEGMDSKDGQEFDLVYMGKNLIDQLDSTLEAAGLKNATVNLEFID